MPRGQLTKRQSQCQVTEWTVGRTCRLTSSWIRYSHGDNRLMQSGSSSARSSSGLWVGRAGRPRRGYVTVTVTTDSWCGEDKATRTASKAAVPDVQADLVVDTLQSRPRGELTKRQSQCHVTEWTVGRTCMHDLVVATLQSRSRGQLAKRQFQCQVKEWTVDRTCRPTSSWIRYSHGDNRLVVWGGQGHEDS
ncbi:hypothetical protein J6590_018218 [Homalodisca vitripennis]|nr:hypothetical protein J6590_018218 [Homalodisca vitripennis]